MLAVMDVVLEVEDAADVNVANFVDMLMLVVTVAAVQVVVAADVDSRRPGAHRVL